MNINVCTQWRKPKENFFQAIASDVKSIKYMNQRAERGYCTADVWNFDYFICNVIVGGLRELSKITTSYPEGFENIENWQDWLKETADLIDYGINFEDCSLRDFAYNVNKYKTAKEEASIKLHEGMYRVADKIEKLWE